MIKYTNKYTQQQKAQSDILFTFHLWIGQWKDVILDKKYAVLALFMLLGILHKQIQRTYFCKNYFLYTPPFSEIPPFERSEVIIRYLCFSDNLAISEYEGPAELFNIYPTIQYLNYSFQKLYMPHTNTETDKFFIL